MFEFTESIRIAAPPAKVWDYVADVERWWLASNPDHIRMDVGGDGAALGPGTEVTFEERVAGLRGRAEGTVTRWVPGNLIEWEGRARYHYLGLPLQVREGVSWQVEGSDGGSRLSARVWAEFPSGLLGRFFEWYAKSMLDVVDRDREHARRELEYLKFEIEAVHQLTGKGLDKDRPD
ncbi:MAG: SRPBCC family protein [Anaerolineae bacterium]